MISVHNITRGDDSVRDMHEFTRNTYCLKDSKREKLNLEFLKNDEYEFL